MNPARIVCFLLALSALSCEKVIDTFTLNDTYNHKVYFPTTIGYWVDYQIDSTRHIKSTLDPEPITTRSTTYIREIIEDSLLGFDTPYQFKIKVLSRKSLTQPWVFVKNNSIQPNKDYITKNEGNLRFIKLYSPINARISWKGNKFIDISITKLYGDWDYRYIEIFQSKNVLAHSFDSTVTVLQYLDSNAIEKTHLFETYAPQIGLIHSEYHKLEKQTIANSWDKPENGYSVVKRIIDWKK